MKFLKNKAISIPLVLVLLAVGVVFAQTQFTEVNDLMFRSRTPQIRASGNISVRDLAGTGAGVISAARNAIVTTAATRTIASSECGSVIVGNATSGTQVFTLPGIANTGCMLTFVAGHASGEILINAASVVTCVHTHFSAVGGAPTTAIVTDASCETGIKNTAATNAIGDTLTLVSDGTRWLGVGIASGIWGSQ